MPLLLSFVPVLRVISLGSLQPRSEPTFQQNSKKKEKRKKTKTIRLKSETESHATPSPMAAVLM